MLSAVAARKARLEGKNLPVDVLPKSSPTALAQPSPPPEPVASIGSSKTSSKRKPSESVENLLRKKSRKQTRTEKKGARYFQQDEFRKQEDLILIDDSEDDEDDDESQDDLSVDGEVFDYSGLTSQNAAVAASTGRNKRAWSPSEPLQDSSSEEEDEVSNGDEAGLGALPFRQGRAPPESPILLSTFQPILNQNMFHLTTEETRALCLTHLSSNSNATLLIMVPSETLTLVGVYSLTVIYGSVSLSGAILSASAISYRVFAPRSAPLPVIQCLTSGASTLCGETSAIPPRAHTAAAQSAALIVLQELYTGVEGLERVCRTFDGIFAPTGWRRGEPSALNLQGAHMASLSAHGLSPLLILPSWRTAFDAVLSNIPENSLEFDYSRRVYLVKGPRNSGKSTFARTLINKLTHRYRRVAFLECDPGQSEFTPGGLIALNIIDKPVFGPPFTHPSIPHAAHYIGATSPRSCPTHYLECIKALVQTYNIDIQHAALLSNEGTESADDRIADVIPLVVNTMGWTKGLGADLAWKIEQMVEPSDIFKFENSEEEWFSADFSGSSLSRGREPHRARLHFLNPAVSTELSKRYTASDHRNMSILSYLHATFPSDASTDPLGNTTATSWNTALPLCAHLPYEVDCRTAFDDIVLTGPGMEDIVLSELHHVLNGAIVGLVEYEPGTFENEVRNDSSTPSSTFPYSQGAPPPPPSISTCRGLALLRSLSPSSLVLHLLTPIPPLLLSSSRTLVKGELELPVWGMLDFRTMDSGDVAGIEAGKVPFLKWGKSEGVGGERRRVRRNLMRRNQM
ncbi:uncharacterized protein FIBRA_05366 [Fibroporia radiculosa]|uniref:Polynucleotide 5'-hydroxyl-kinase GRC3 n=1 Tax=Fibroporia radiculosa TaxID=599839 RepID=J4IAN9_9APHY|nr:uncharacterized protein FIBRA_05366 [Fibroporia radiculosa]CCM03241.1 predicted protein [Fibroporia radiculosa]